MALKVVPELCCLNITQSCQYYCDVLGFSVKYARAEEHFAYLTLKGNDLMLEGLQGEQRHWITGTMTPPFGRGINFQWEVDNLSEMYEQVQLLAPESLYMPLETKSYQCGREELVQQQFIVQDPNGYLLRFCQAC